MKNIQLKTIGKMFLGIIIASSLLIGCSKDLFYISGSVQEEMDKAIEGGFDGMIIYVNQSGKSKFYSAGFNNREKQILASPNDLFKIASISKLYIAAATTKLLAIDSLSLDQTLAELIPEVENRIENADQITLRTFFMVIGFLYVANLVLILINTLRINNKKEVIYSPQIKFLK